MKGKLIVIEGIDGSGKSTQFQLLSEKFDADGIDFRRIVFPRYEHQSSALIRMYLNGEFGTEPDAVNAYAASSFFAVDRYASFVQDWRDYYNNGGLIVTDRYTTSNAIHQGAKLSEIERPLFFDWLYEYEFRFIGLPRPDLTFFMNINPQLAARRLAMRQAETDTRADIHERDTAYLRSCAKCGLQAASHLGWRIVECTAAGVARGRDEISDEIYSVIRGCL